MLRRVNAATTSSLRFIRVAQGVRILPARMSISGFAANSAAEEESTKFLPATFVRGGTSKGVFLTKSSLPSDPTQWTPIFLSIMGSPDPQYGRQLNGMGGGISSLSKIMIISPPSAEHKEEGIDVEYTFAQVGVKDESVDYSGNCGNLTSMIGVYAVDEGMCVPKRLPGAGRNGQLLGTVKSFNTNTQKVIDTTFPISEKGVPILDLPQATVAGVPGKASKIVSDFINPGGARTGKLLPSGNPTDTLEIILPDNSDRKIKASLVDATNPTVFVSFIDLNDFLPMEEYFQGAEPATKEVSLVLETIRQAGAKKMGLDPTAQAQPKIAILRAQHTPADAEQGVNVVCNALSMGVLHKAIPMTVGLCLGVASKIEGTLAWDIVQGGTGAQGAKLSNGAHEEDSDLVRIRHPGGLVDVGAEFGADGEVKSAKVVRTGRRLMKGVVWY